MNTSWVPSHVQVTVHQARDLLLKGRNGNSEVYVCLQVEREKFLTGNLPKQTTPQWGFTADIPLMSLDTTIHISVRQTGKFREYILGYLGIPLGNFNLSSRAVTHWYKLGARPGKVSAKLRGDLKVTIKFLSKWTTVDAEPLVRRSNSKKMLRRSKSDQKIKPKEVGKTPSVEKSQPKDKLAIFRMSFKKKSKCPVFEECEDDFAMFTSSQSPSRTPQTRLRSHTLDVRLHTHSNGTTASKSQSDSENSDVSPSMSKRANVQALFAEAAALEKSVDQEGGSLDNGTPSQQKITPGMKFHNFRRKRRPWSMQLIPVPTTPTSTDAVTVLGVVEEGGDTMEPEDEAINQSEQCKESLVVYRAKSTSLARMSPHFRGRPRSYSVSESQHSVTSPSTEQESTSESCSETNTPAYSPQMSSVRHRMAGGDEVRIRRSSFSGSATSREDILKDGARTPRSSKVATDVRKTRPRMLSFGGERPKNGSSLGTPSRKPQPSTQTQHVVEEGEFDMISTQSEKDKLNSESESMDQVTPNSTPDPATVSTESHNDNSKAVKQKSSINGRTTPDSELSSAPSVITPDRKMKHTVIYKESSPLLKKGKAFEPVSLLPPSLTDYHSKTLPTRRMSQKLSDVNRSLSGNVREGTITPKSHPDRSPENIRTIDRRILNYPPGSVPPPTPSPKISPLPLPYATQQRPLSTAFEDIDLGDTPSTPSIPANSPFMPLARRRWKTGGLRRALTTYQENKRHSMASRTRKKEDTQSSLSTEGRDRVSVSAGNSPEPHSRSPLETSWRSKFNNPFATIRRTKSHCASLVADPINLCIADDLTIPDEIKRKLLKTSSPQASPKTTPLLNTSSQISFQSVSESPIKSIDSSDSPQKSLCSAEDLAIPEDIKRKLLKTSSSPTITPLLNTTSQSSLQSVSESPNESIDSSKASNSPPHQNTISPLRDISLPECEITSRPTDSESVKTLTVNELDVKPLRVFESLRPGASSHRQTCSSVESEGVGSITSEDLTLEDLSHQDWSQWSKEELVKELIHSKQRLCSTEEELLSVKSYLDNLLLRIMETNPAILSASS